MNALQRPTLESMHRTTGRLLQDGQRLLCPIVMMGAIFCAFSYGVANLVQQPEAFLQTKGFMFNYAEIAQGAAAPYMKANNQPFLPEHPKDPNWDGTLAGASVGFTVGQDIPFIGSVCGPVLGAIMGYQLDSRI